LPAVTKKVTTAESPATSQSRAFSRVPRAFTVLSAGLGAALWQAREARVQRDEARLESARADAEASFLSAMMSDLGEPNEVITPTKVLEKGLDVVAAQSQENPEAAVDVLIGMSGRFMDMGDHRRELDALMRAEKIARPLPNPLALARVQCNAVETEIILGNMERAAARLAEGQADLARAARARIDDELTCVDAGAAFSEAQGRTQEAIAALERSVSLRERNGMRLRITFAPILQRLAGLHTTLGDIKRAYQYDHEAAEQRAAGTSRYDELGGVAPQ
jgi:eukaryotic-like serine/threonine-protein kinase